MTLEDRIARLEALFASVGKSNGWHTTEDLTTPTTYRVEEWRNGQRTGRLSRRYPSIIEAILVREVLDLFAKPSA
jgi:hypothetical protein